MTWHSKLSSTCLIHNSGLLPSHVGAKYLEPTWNWNASGSMNQGERKIVNIISLTRSSKSTNLRSDGRTDTLILSVTVQSRASRYKCFVPICDRCEISQFIPPGGPTSLMTHCLVSDSMWDLTIHPLLEAHCPRYHTIRCLTLIPSVTAQTHRYIVPFSSLRIDVSLMVFERVY